MASLQPNGGTLEEVRRFGLKVCQVVNWNADLWTDEAADRLREESRTSGVRITSLWTGYPGKSVWNYVDGPTTLGLIPKEWRAARVAALKRGGEFAQRAGLPATITHLGFIPENPKDPTFLEIVATVRDIAEFLGERGLEFWFETGQETPVTLLRLIEDVGTGNLGINLDPANLILYGKGNPVDALDVLGPYVRNIHAKDGLYPTDPNELGREVKVGQGRVRFPEFVARLREIGYTAEFIIEREITGEQQRRDIAETVEYLRSLL
jgi:sugar phosphate isomerase/epimerase